MNENYKVTVKQFVDAAHMLPDSTDLVTKQCANLHGHTYLIQVEFWGVNDRGGMVVDFRGIKNIINGLDHTTLLVDTPANRLISDAVNSSRSNFNLDPQKFVWLDYPPTAENIARFLYDSIQYAYSDLQHIIVSVCEGYKGSDNSQWVSYNPILSELRQI